MSHNHLFSGLNRQSLSVGALSSLRIPFRAAPRAPVALLACSFLCPLAASAQDLETNTPPTSATQPSTVPFIGNTQSQPASASGYVGVQPASPIAGTSQLAVAPPFAGAPASAGLVHWGIFHLYPHLSYTVSYGNSLQSSPGQTANALINEVSPGILIKIGDHWSLDYTPTMRFYSNRQLNDAVDHIVGLSGTTTYEDWMFGFFQGYSSTSQPLIETASQLSQEIYSTSLRATHPLGSKLSLDLNLSQNFRYVDQGQQLGFASVSDTRSWSTMDWVSYKFTTRLSAGIGVGLGYDNLSVGSDMTSEQLQARVSWSATDKLSFSVSGGGDYRQFIDSTVPNLLSPIFSASAQYQLFENTSLSLSASRSVSPSYFQNSVSEATSVNLGLRQRLLRRLSLDVSGGYSSSSYDKTSTSLASANANNYESTSFSVRLSTVFLKRIGAAVFFQENFVSSGASSASSRLFNYTTTQGGLSLSYHF
jgi:hypothetical protein